MSYLIITIIAVAIALGSTFVLKLPDDNAIEEIAEEVIEKETGVDVDLSPGSKEK